MNRKSILLTLLVAVAVAVPSFVAGLGIDRLLSRKSGFTTIGTEVELTQGQTQLVVTTMIRKHEVIGVPLYCISLRDTSSGLEFPLLTLQDAFQEPPVKPVLTDHDKETVRLSAGKGTVEIHLPSVKTQGLPEGAAYAGPPK